MRFVVIIAWVCMLWGGVWIAPAFATVNGDAELLLMLADGFVRNHEGLRTWQGNATIQSLNTRDGASASEAITEVSFVSDRAQRSVAWNWTQTQGSRDGQRVEPFTASGMIVGQQTTSIQAHVSTNRPTGLGVVVDSAVPGPQPLDAIANAFDPYAYFYQPTHDTSRFLRWNYDNRANVNIYPIDVTREGSRITVEASDRQDGRVMVLNRYVFDVDQGCNLVEYEGRDDTNETHRLVEYAKIGGVFVPAKVTDRSIIHRDEETTSRDMTITFALQRVNEPVAENAFTFEGIGVQVGDNIFDNIAGINYVYQPHLQALASDISAAIPLSSQWKRAEYATDVASGGDASNSTAQPIMAAATSGHVAANGGNQILSALGPWLAAAGIALVIVVIIAVRCLGGAAKA